MSPIQRPNCHLLPLCAVFLALSFCAAAHAANEKIQAVAQPNRVVYGADNRLTITVTVRDSKNAPVADGTPVYFNATLGVLPAIAYTKQGRVDVLMDNNSGPGLSVVTITAGDAHATLNIEYLGQGESAVSKAQRVNYRLRAKQVYYSVDQRTFDLRDAAELRGPELTLTASAIQYNVKQGLVCAQDNVTLTVGKKTLSARNLRMTLGTANAAIIVSEPELAYQTVTLATLDVADDETVRNIDFKPLDPQPTRTWILSKQAVVYPNEQIQFRRPEFYLDNFNHRLYSLPYHVLDLRSSQAGLFFNSEVSLTSDAGLNVDFPIYYAANDSHIGAVHLREAAQGAFGYRGTSGFEVGIQEEYLLGQYADGGLFLDDLLRPTRSVSWEHNHDFGKHTNVSLNASYERFDADVPYTQRAGMNATHDFGGTLANFSTNWSGVAGNLDTISELRVQPPRWNLGKTGLSLNADPYLGLTYNVEDAVTGVPESTRTNFYQGLRLGMGFPGINFLGGTFSPSLNNEYAHEQDGTFTQYFDAGISYNHRLTANLNSVLSYAYNVTQRSTDTERAQPSQHISLDTSGRFGRALGVNAYSNYNFDSKLYYHSLYATYFLPWFRREDDSPRCSLQYNASLTTGEGQPSSSDQLFSLAWNFGSYSIVARYSPTGNNSVTGIGTGTGKHWAVELVRIGW